MCALSCGIKGCKHQVLCARNSTICCCTNTTWLQHYCADLGLENMVKIYTNSSWTCTICMVAMGGSSEHYSRSAGEHLRESLVWLTDLMQSVGSGNIAKEDLKIHDESFVFKILISPHDRVGQGLLKSSWRTAKVGTDKCQCTLEQATKKIDLSAANKTTSQQEDQNIPKEVSKGPLWGLEEWDKGAVCAIMSTPSPSASLVSYDPEETVC